MSANPHAGLKINDDDATIEVMLADLNMPTLMSSLVHMTGDFASIRGTIKPRGHFLNEVQGFMPEEMQLDARDARATEWGADSADAHTGFPVAVIGQVRSSRAISLGEQRARKTQNEDIDE